MVTRRFLAPHPVALQVVLTQQHLTVALRHPSITWFVLCPSDCIITSSEYFVCCLSRLVRISALAASMLLCMQVGSTVFVHGGILPEHAAYGLERMNADCRAWMEGAPDARMPAFLGGRRAVVWARDYSNGAHEPVQGTA